MSIIRGLKMTQHYSIGLDIGTSVIKAAAFSQTGTLIKMVSEPAPKSKIAGRASQDMNAIWDITKRLLSLLVEKLVNIAPLSIGVCGQGDGLWMLDDMGDPLNEAFLWNDSHAQGPVDSWASSKAAGTASAKCGTELWAGTSAALYKQMQIDTPEIAAKVATILHAKDWINFKLTGSLATDFSDATIPFFDLTLMDYASESFKQLGVEALQDAVLPPQLSASKLGSLLKEVAHNVGLPDGLPVAVGSIDVGAMHVGLGLNAPGDVLLILGTTAVVGVVTDATPPTPPIIGATLVHPMPGRFIRALAPLNGASALDWAQTALGGGTALEKLLDEAAKSKIGAGNVLFLPHLDGERAPFVAPRASGVFTGLTSNTRRGDMIRAVLEGVAFSMRHCIMVAGVSMPERVTLTGGGAKSPLWRQILADVIGCSVTVDDSADHGLWGAALLGMVAANHLPSPELKRNSSKQSYTPDPNARVLYDIYFQKYCDAETAMASTFKND